MLILKLCNDKVQGGMVVRRKTEKVSSQDKFMRGLKWGVLVAVVILALALVYRQVKVLESDTSSWTRQSIFGLGVSVKVPPTTSGNDTPNGSQPAVVGLELGTDYRLEVRDISGSTSGEIQVNRVATVKINGVKRYILARDIGQRGKTTAIYLSDCAQTLCGITHPETGKRIEVTLWKETSNRSGSSNPATNFWLDEDGAREGVEVLKLVQFE